MRERFPHTFDHRNCPACEYALRVEVAPLDVKLTFAEASRQWVARYALGDGETDVRYIAPRTESDLYRYAATAARFLGRLRLEEIHLGHLREYQRARAVCDQRAAPFAQPAGANVIRKEIQTVIRILGAAGLWDDETNKRLRRVQKVESDVPRAMTPQEQERFLEKAGSQVEWHIIRWYSLVVLRTTAATNEMRSLRLDDVTLGPAASIQVRNRGAKNKFRVRTIPVRGAAAQEALALLVARAKKLGANSGDCYLFPLHLTWDRYDARRPMTVFGLRKRWEAVREAAGLPGLHTYDLRHAALTRMAEAGTPIHVMMAFAGHMSMRMQRHYIAISMAAKQEWAERVWGQPEFEEQTLPPKIGPKSVGTSAVTGSESFFLTNRRKA